MNKLHLAALLVTIGTANAVLSLYGVAVHHTTPMVYRVNPATLLFQAAGPVKVPAGHIHVPSVLDPQQHVYITVVFSEESPQPVVTRYETLNLTAHPSVTFTRGTIDALEISGFGQLVGVGKDQDTDILSFINVDINGRQIRSVCNVQDGLSFGQFSAIDGQILYGNFFEPFTADLTPWIGYCNLTSGQSKFSRISRQVQELVVTPRVGGASKLLAVLDQDIVTVNPETGAFTPFAKLPKRPFSPSLVAFRNVVYGLLELENGDWNQIEIEPTTGSVSQPYVRVGVGFALEHVKFDDVPL